MRCALVGPSAPIRGGIAVDNDSLAQALRQAGHRVEQISFRRLYPSLFFPGRSQYDDSRPPPQIPAQACIDTLNPLSWFSTARTIARFQPDVITFQWWHPFFAPCYAAILALLTRTCPTAPRLLLSHNTRPHEPLPGQDAALRFVVQRCSGVLVHSQSEHDLTLGVVPHATVRIAGYPVLETSRDLPERAVAQQQLGVSGRVVLFFGYIREYKGLDMLLHALAQTPPELAVSLLVAGEFYAPLHKYQELMQSLGITNRVRILDRYVGEAEWPNLFAATDALVLPYRTASHSMSIALSYGYGKPVIVTRVGGLAEAVDDGKTGFVADPNPRALATAMQRLYTELLVSPYQTHLATKRQQFGWEPFLQLLTNWPESMSNEHPPAV